MQENNFVVFKKSMRKYIFKTSNIFFIYIKKECSKHVRVLAVCNTQENIFFKTTSIRIKFNQSITYILKFIRSLKQKNYNWREIKHVYEGAKIMKPEFNDSAHTPSTHSSDSVHTHKPIL